MSTMGAYPTFASDEHINLLNQYNEQIKARFGTQFLDAFGKTALDYRLVAHATGREPDRITEIEYYDLINWATYWLSTSDDHSTKDTTMINRNDIIEGRRFTVNGRTNADADVNLTVLKVGHEFVAVVYDNGEVDAWYIDTAVDNWSHVEFERPAWVDTMWANVDCDGSVTVFYTASDADNYAHSNRIGRISLATGEWVPCHWTLG
jgi:hypothetical protein